VSEVSGAGSGGAGWSFPEGAVGHRDSVKGYDVEGTDGHVGTVSWASYKPGESYCVVDCGEHAHHVVPAGAVVSVDHERRRVTLAVPAAQVLSTPVHEDPEAGIDSDLVEHFERGMFAGGFALPSTDEQREE